MQTREISHIMRQEVLIKQFHALGIIIHDLLPVLKDHGRALERRHVDEEEVAGAGDVEVVHEVEVLVHAAWEAVAERDVGGAGEEEGAPVYVVDADPGGEDAGVAVPGHAHATTVARVGTVHHWLLHGHVAIVSVVEGGVLGLVDVEELVRVAIGDTGAGDGKIISQGCGCVPFRCQIFRPVRSIRCGLIGDERVAE